MWVSYACVQKFNCSNVLPSLFFFMCVPLVPATFMQIFIPGVKRSWSPSSVYSPVLSLTLTFFILTESDRRQGTQSQGGAEKEQVSIWVRSGEEGESEEKAFGEERETCSEKEASGGAGRALSVMDDLSSYRNQKPNLPIPLLAKAHDEVVQWGPMG